MVFSDNVTVTHHCLIVIRSMKRMMNCWTIYHIAGKFGGFKIWRICSKMHLAFFKFGGSAPYNYYCTMNLIIICLTVRAKDCERATMQVFSVDSCIRGHHVYKDIWSPTAESRAGMCERKQQYKGPVRSCSDVRGVACVGASSSTVLLTCLLVLKQGHRDSNQTET